MTPGPARQPAACRPRSLRVQLLWLLAGVTVLAMAVLYDLSARRLAAAEAATSQRWADSVARTAAAIAAPRLAAGDAPSLEAALRELAAMPGVLRVDVHGHEGQPLLVLEQGTQGRVQRLAPAADTAAADALQVWAGAGPGGSLGSVGVRYALVGERHPLAALRHDMLAAIGLVGLLMLGAAYGLVARAVAPLALLTRFAHDLAGGHGPQLRLASRTCEIGDLATALNHASAALHAQLEQVRALDAARQALLNAVPDVLLGLDEHGVVRLANPGVTSVFGLPPEQVAGLPLAQLLPGLDAETAETRMREGLYMRSTRSHVARFEMQARRHDGTPFPAEVSLSRTDAPAGARYAALVRDMTEPRVTTGLLHLYGRALECAANGIVIADVSLPGHAIVYVNPAYERITGYAPDDVIGRSPRLLHRGDREQPGLDEMRAAVASGRGAQAVLRNYRKDGTPFFNQLAIAPVHAHEGGVRHYVGVLEDVTERERARLALAERSARLNAVFELSPDGFVVFDAAARLVYCNRAFLAMTGWTQGTEVQGLTMAQFEARLAAQCDAAERPRPLAEALADAGAGEPVPESFVLLRPERRVLARVARAQREGQRESILFFRDITRESEVDRMKSEFLSTAAHELRTPMASVFGFTELLLHRPVSESRRREVLETIHRQAGRLIGMVNELLDLARIEARQGKDIRRRSCRVADLVHGVMAPLLLAPRGADMVVDLADGDLVLHVDPEKTDRALANVLSNAVKYSPKGGPVVVTTQRGRLHGAPAVGIRVADRGIGMAPDELALVFERFYRADPSGMIPGTGLGMSLVKEIVELQGGRVDVASEPGAGTRVTLWLPCAEAAPDTAIAAAHEAAHEAAAASATHDESSAHARAEAAEAMQ